MTLLEPGQYWNGVEVVDNPAFASLRAQKPPQPSKAERLFSSGLYAAQAVHRQGIPVTPDTMHSENPDVPKRLYADLLTNEKFLTALAERGIDLVSPKGLTPEQESALSIYFDMGLSLTHAQRLKAAGITDAKWRGWLRQEDFAREHAAIAEAIIADTRDVSLVRLAEAVDRGERWAVELTLELTGRHDRRNLGVDPAAAMMTVFQVLDDAAIPPQVMARVAEALRGMLGSATPRPIVVAAVSRPADQPQQALSEAS